MVGLALQGGIISGTALGTVSGAGYQPTLDDVKRMKPRPMVDSEMPGVTQEHEEWTETIRFENFGLDTFSTDAGARVFTLPANPGTEVIEVTIEFNTRAQVT